MTSRVLGGLLAVSLVVGAGQASAAGRSVAFRASDGTPLSGMLYESGVQPSPALVLVHMLTRSHADWAPAAEQLQQAGFLVLALDLRGHGDSGGHYDPAGDLGVMQQDVQAAVSLLAARSDVNRGHIGIAGASIGANLAVLVGAADPSVRSLALLSPGLENHGVKCEAAMKKYVPRPALLVAASNDPYALRSVKQLATGGTSNEILTLDAVGHGTIMLSRAPDLVSQLVDWFKKTLL